MLAGIIPHPFFLYLFGFQKNNNKFLGGVPTCDPLKSFSTTPPLKISQSLPKNVLTGTTTSLPIHFSSSLYLFFTFDINSSCYKGDVASCYVQISVDCVFRILELSVGWCRRKEAGWLIHPSLEREYYCL